MEFKYYCKSNTTEGFAIKEVEIPRKKLVEKTIEVNRENWFYLPLIFKERRLIKGRILIPNGSLIVITENPGIKVSEISIDDNRVSFKGSMEIGVNMGDEQNMVIGIPEPVFIAITHFPEKKPVYLSRGSMVQIDLSTAGRLKKILWNGKTPDDFYRAYVGQEEEIILLTV